MVTQYGMSKKFGLISLESVENRYLDGRPVLNCGDNTAAEIDQEVQVLLKDSYETARKLLEENRDVLDKIAEYLFEHETITGKEFMRIYREIKGIPEPQEAEGEKEEIRFGQNVQGQPQNAQRMSQSQPQNAQGMGQSQPQSVQGMSQSQPQNAQSMNQGQTRSALGMNHQGQLYNPQRGNVQDQQMSTQMNIQGQPQNAQGMSRGQAQPYDPQSGGLQDQQMNTQVNRQSQPQSAQGMSQGQAQTAQGMNQQGYPYILQSGGSVQSYLQSGSVQEQLQGQGSDFMQDQPNMQSQQGRTDVQNRSAVIQPGQDRSQMVQERGSAQSQLQNPQSEDAQSQLQNPQSEDAQSQL